MWAVGAIAFLIAAGELPFPTYNQRSLGRYARGKSSLPMHVLQKADVSSTGRELIQSLLARQPSQRPSAVDCLHHEWLDGSRAADSRSETTVETIVPSLSAPSSASASWDTPEDKMQTIGPNRLSAHPPPVESAEDQSAERQHLSVLLRPTSVDDGLVRSCKDLNGRLRQIKADCFKTLNHSSFVETQRFDLLPPMPEPYLDHGVVGAVPSQLEPQINQTVHSIPEDGGPITNTTNKFKDGKKHHGRIKDQRSLLIEDFEATKLESRGGRRRYEPSVRVKVVPIEQGNPSGKAVMQIVRRDKDGKLSTTRKILLGTDRKNAETEHAPHEGAKSLQSSKSNVFGKQAVATGALTLCNICSDCHPYLLIHALGEMDVSLTPPHKLLKDDISVDVHEESQITGKKPSSPPDRFNSLQAKSTSTHLQPGHDRGPRKPQALIRRGHEMKPDSHERKIRPSSLDDQGDDDTVSIVESVLPYSGIQPLRSGDHLAETSQAQKVNNLHLLSGRLTEPIPVLSSRPSANFDALQREAQTVVVANARSNTSQVQDPRFQDIMTPTETQFLPVFSATPWHRTFEHKKMPQNSPIFSPDGRMFAAACDSQRRLYVLDMSSTGESTYIDTESCTNTIAFSLDSWYLLSLSTGGLYQRWNLASRLEEGRTRLCLPKNRHIDSAILLPDNLALTSSPDFTNRRVLSEVQLWDVKSATLIWTLEYRDSIQGLCVSSERRVLVAKGGEENCVWHLEADIRQGTKYGQHPRKCTSYPGKQSLAISRDGQLLAQSRWGSIPIWNIKDWEQVRDLQTGGSALAFSPVADILAELSSQHIRLWDVATGRIVRTIEVPRSFEQCTLNFSPDGTVLAYSDSNHTTLYCWKIAIACTPDCKGNSEKKIPHTYL